MHSSNPSTPAIRVSRVIGTRVVGEFGQKIGVIDDIVLDKYSNGVLYVVICRNGFWGLSNMYLRIPWSSLRYDLFDRSYKLEGSRAGWLGGWQRSPDKAALAAVSIEYPTIRIRYPSESAYHWMRAAQRVRISCRTTRA
jgi:sporulation protein YlmC with PRC-barrel domain